MESVMGKILGHLKQIRPVGLDLILDAASK